MTKELVISSTPHETKVAVLEDDQLVEIYFQRANEYSLAGSIHKGRVTRVLPGMQSAFVDLGLERDTFLYVSDFFEENGEDIDRVDSDRTPPPRRDRDRGDRDRGDRERGGDRERREAPPVQIPPPPPTAVEPIEEIEVAAAGPELSVERVEESGDPRDRRNRRSRRRRSRGRGFPDSKYAADVPPGTSGERRRSAAEVPSFVRDEEDEAPAGDVILLPGESLAKYRRPSGEEDPAGEGEAVDFEEAAVIEEERIDDGAGPLTEENDTASFEGAVDEDEPELDVEPESEPEAEEDAPATEAEADAEVEAPVETEDVVEAANAILDAIDEIEAPESDTSSDTEIDADLDTEPNPYADTEIDSEEETVEPVEVSGPPAGDDQRASASVREQGGRYPHRGSRRMRRRRGGDSRTESAPPAAPLVEAEPRQAARGERPERAERGDKGPLPSISDLLREGQEIIVQIAKEPLGQKGARITSHIALPGRYVVFMPTLEHLGVSRKIASDEERLRLKRILQAHRAGIVGGFIVRTAGEGHTEEEIAADMAYLYNLWLDIRQKAEKKKAPVLLHHDLDIVHRILRDQLSDMFKAIWVDNEDVYESILRFMQRFQPSLVGRVKMYTRPTPIFEGFAITQEIEKALRPKVWLKSGGYIVINQTEALVAVDVNTGKYVGKSNRLEDTITKTNTEAVKEIVRQIRLRDLGGIIVIDFIDMDERKNRQKVMQALEEAMRADRAPYKILQFNDFGLVAITRKRVKQSLERSLCAPCPTCEGAGYVKSVPTVVGEILQEAAKIRSVAEGNTVELRVFPEVAKVLKSNDNSYLEEVEQLVGCPVMVISDSRLHPEKFDMAW